MTYKEYLEKQPNFLSLLSNLRSFVDGVRSYKKSSDISISDLLEFVTLMKQNNLPLVDTWQLLQSSESVTLLTAHKSKGMEFGTVFVVNCSNVGWTSRGRSNKIPSPANLPLLAEADENDDKLRLFYVAITRARTNLFLTSYSKDSNNKEMQPLEFLEGVIEPEEVSNVDQTKIQPEQAWQNLNLVPKVSPIKERQYLTPLLQNYKLSATHLNNFLDIYRGGPDYFKKTNLLHFPQPNNPESLYGSAVHKTLADFYAAFQDTEDLPSQEFLLSRFESNLSKLRFNNKDRIEKLKFGNRYLTNYYQHNLNRVRIDQLIEFDFSNQNIRIGEAWLTGKIDKMTKDTSNSIITVADFKTGKSYDRWSSSDRDTAIKLNKYHRQLVFYKLLVENSREFGGKFIVESGELEFLHTKTDGPVQILQTQITEDETTKLKKLIEVVYTKIVNCDFPSVEKYSQDVKGTEDFIEDLLENNA